MSLDEPMHSIYPKIYPGYVGEATCRVTSRFKHRRFKLNKLQCNAIKQVHGEVGMLCEIHGLCKIPHGHETTSDMLLQDLAKPRLVFARTWLCICYSWECVQ